MGKLKNNNQGVRLTSPKEMVKEMDKYVIGQDETKKTLAIAVYNHYKRLMNNRLSDNPNVEFDKSNCIIAGNSGSGKTLLVKTIAKMLDVPLYIKDITACTSAGYVGEDVETCLSGLIGQANGNVSLAELGIVVLDEFDKIAKKDAGVSITKDVSGESVQQALLKIVEGDKVGVQLDQRRKHPEAGMTYIDTSNILFIAIGAFSGIETIIKTRIGKNSIGFGVGKHRGQEQVKDDEVMSYLTGDDLKKFGFIPEIIGRFPIISSVKKLSEEDLMRILTEPKNSIIKQYEELLKMDNTKLIVTQEALREIAHLANTLGTGARALRNITELVLEDVMFNAPDNVNRKNMVKVVVDGDYVKEKAQKLTKFRESAA